MKKLLGKMSLVVVLLVAVMVTLGCESKAKYTVSYYSFSAPTKVIGTETVSEGKAPTGVVKGYVLDGGLFTDAEGKVAFGGKVTSNVSLYGNFGEPEYTYLTSFSLSPSTFNPLNYRSTTDSVPLDYTTNSFFEFSYNDAGTGFELKPVMAAADPEDVTDLYNDDDSYGIKDKASGYAFRIKLNKDAAWENGVKITADDYIYTFQELLDPKMSNYRASHYYSGGGAIFGAKDFFYSGQKGVGKAGLTYSVFEESIFDKLIFTWDSTQSTDFLTWLNGTYGSYVGTASYPTKLDLLIKGFGGAFAYTDGTAITDDDVAALHGKTYAEICAVAKDKEVLDALFAFYCTEPNEELVFFQAEYNMPIYEFEKVGLKKIDEYTIDIIYMNEIAGFYKKYNIGLPLVYKPLYESCKKVDENGVWSSSYGTSKETYIGYGPYKLTRYILDQVMEFERNENWFGYKEAYKGTYGDFVAEFDGKVHQQYQTSRILIQYVPEISTREQMFLKGELDIFGMNKEYFDKYKSSIRLYNATGASTFYGILLSDYDSLVAREAVLNGKTYDSATYNGASEKYNKTILSIKEFRQALTYAIDRSKVVANLYPGGSPATSLYSDLIIADPDNGIAFNSFETVKAAVCEFWGIEYGEGKPYANVEEAIDAITGYDLQQAKELVNQAVDKAVELGFMSERSIVKIDHCESSDNETSQKWYNTFKECFLELVKGTKLEGKFEYDYNTNLGSNFGGSIQSGLADTSWGFGWSGGELDPYDLLQVYVDAADESKDEPYQYDKWINRGTKDYEVTVEVDLGEGVKPYTYSVYDWYMILNGLHKEHNMKYLQVANEDRAKVLAACELRILLDYTTVPLMNQGSVQLLSFKINYGKETYMFGMGFGGLRYMTYNFNDVEWRDYVAAQAGGIVSY